MAENHGHDTCLPMTSSVGGHVQPSSGGCADPLDDDDSLKTHHSSAVLGSISWSGKS